MSLDHGDKSMTLQEKNQSTSLAPVSTQAVTETQTQTQTTINSTSPQPIKVPTNPSPKTMLKTRPALNFRIANGKIANEYRSVIEVVSVTKQEYSIKFVELPDDLGLLYDPTLSEIYGIPAKDGEFKIVVWYVIEDADIAQSSVINLVINPDPKSLWKDYPSNTDDPYWKKDMDSLIIQGDRFSLVAASKRGRSHAHVGSFRDDDFHLSYLNDGKWYIAIVSDGAGSAKYSRRGSQIICHEGGLHLKALLTKEGANIIQAIEEWEAARVSGTQIDSLELRIKNSLYTTIGYTAHHVTRLIIDECKVRADLGGVFKDYSSTAIIGLCRRFSFGVLCAAYWIGDGAVTVMRNNHDPILLGVADSGEYSGQTRFLDSAAVNNQESLLKRINFAIVDDFKSFILMTDGVSDPFFETEANLSNPAKWSSLWNDIESKAGLLQRDQSVTGNLIAWLDFWSQGNHDDRTIAAIY